MFKPNPAILRQNFCTFSSMINHHWLCIQLMNISLWHIPSFLLRHYLSQVHSLQLSTTRVRVISHILNTHSVNQAFILDSGLQAVWVSLFTPAAKSSTSYCVTWWTDAFAFFWLYAILCSLQCHIVKSQSRSPIQVFDTAEFEILSD